MSFLDINHISKFQEDKAILTDINLSIPAFQNLGIMGETGSGKSTLLKIIAGLIQPDNGMIYLKDKHVLGPDFKLLPGHKEIAYLSQHFELRNNYRVEDILSYANQLSDPIANAIFEVCLIGHLLKRKTDQLSGGERQRIAIARLLIGKPALLLLDEPFSNLDLIHKNILKNVIREIGNQLKITCILVSHDPADIASWADRLLLMQMGSIIQDANPETVYRYPINNYAAGLLGNYFYLNPNLADVFRLNAKRPKTGQSLFVRPDFFKIVAATEGIPAIIKKKNFLAGNYELEIQIHENSLSIISSENDFNKGDTIHITLANHVFDKPYLSSANAI